MLHEVSLLLCPMHGENSALSSLANRGVSTIQGILMYCWDLNKLL